MQRTGKKPVKSFSLLELIIVVIVMSILLAAAIPAYNRSVERSRGKNAEFSLRAIYNAQKRYWLATGRYYECPGTAGLCSPNNITDNLLMDINDPYFSYTIIANPDQNSAAPAGPTEMGIFTANATRFGGSLCDLQVMSINQNGNLTKNCNFW